ncbi:MAG TPA: mechanosensitive ion channel domain-containing protein [Burkholderiales bacterium]|nr:mechanosensitive ion channel domain-containing protein [Burkholderiales bacterium]
MEELSREAWSQAVLWVPTVFVALGLILLFSILSRAAHFAVLRVVQRTRAHGPLGELLASVARISLLVLGLITALGTLGVNIMGIVAGLGLTGFALGFALKDSIANLLAGVLILLYRPFDVGDHIDVSGFAGKVITVNLRYTELDAGSQLVLVPNSKLLTDPIRVTRQSGPTIQDL